MTDVNEDRTLSTVVAHVRDGGLVIIPTDTVYGIGTLASDAAAVARLLAAKGRGRQMPPPVLVAGPDQLDGVVGALPPAAQALMEAFWPGALTIILDAAPDLGWDLGETGGTIAVRMPDHPLALELLRATGPMAVTSANHTGQPPATDAASARVAFPGRVREAGSPGAGPTAARGTFSCSTAEPPRAQSPPRSSRWPGIMPTLPVSSATACSHSASSPSSWTRSSRRRERPR